MEPLVTHKGKAAVLNRINVDTDQIIPKQFLKESNEQDMAALPFSTGVI